MTPLKIVADKNIPYARDVFAHLGRVELFVGRDLAPATVADADVLLCRSTSRIDAKLLEGSRVRFVGTAVIGTDHVDLGYLAQRKIPFANAAGSNANSVAEYVSAALLVLAERGRYRLAGRSIGVVGVGNVGSRVVQKAAALGMAVVQTDPPLARATGDPRYRSLTEAAGCDFVTLHVPLTKAGADVTFRMVGRDFLAAMRPGASLLNSSRGPVADEKELAAVVRSKKLSAVVLDVWDNEPAIDAGMVELADIVTPHIAGHSLDGKAAGTQMVYEAACRVLGVSPRMDARSFLPPAEIPEIVVGGEGSPEEIVRRTVLRIYNILDDDAMLRKVQDISAADRAEYFDSLRRNYRPRREFYNTALTFRSCPEAARRTLLGLGFQEEG